MVLVHMQVYYEKMHNQHGYIHKKTQNLVVHINRTKDVDIERNWRHIKPPNLTTLGLSTHCHSNFCISTG
jgi:hypothetical protein